MAKAHMSDRDALILALRATAESFRACQPSVDLVLEKLADYLENPETAQRRIDSAEAMRRSIGRIR